MHIFSLHLHGASPSGARAGPFQCLETILSQEASNNAFRKRITRFVRIDTIDVRTKPLRSSCKGGMVALESICIESSSVHFFFFLWASTAQATTRIFQHLVRAAAYGLVGSGGMTYAIYVSNYLNRCYMGADGLTPTVGFMTTIRSLIYYVSRAVYTVRAQVDSESTDEGLTSFASLERPGRVMIR